VDDRLRFLVEVLTEAAPQALSATELLARLRTRWPALTPAQAQRLVEGAGERVVREGSRFRAADSATTATPAASTAQPVAGDDRPWRAVALDVESATRLVTESPYVAAHIFQVGAVRFGRDAEWVGAAERFEAWVELPDGFGIWDPARAERHAVHARPVAEVLGDLARFCAEADALVAHNGMELDFRLLDEAAEAAGVPTLAGSRVDSLYVGLAVWPLPANAHRLRDLAERVGVEVADLLWHDAVDDAVCAARLMAAAAAAVASWDEDRAGLVGAAAGASHTWGLLFDLAGRRLPRRQLRDREVAAVVAAMVAFRPAVRGAGPAPAATVPGSLRDDDGAVDPHRIALAVRGDAERRPAQDEMAGVLRRLVALGTDGMIEAPTGVGKTYAILAAGLDWLATHPAGKVVVATHTKQLQTQLAGDLEALAAAGLGWVATGAGLVKGQTNRLSLRALVAALADCSAAAAGARRRRRGAPVPPAEDPRFAELAVYVLSRLAAMPTRLVEAWESASVDPVDVPAFFDGYLGWRRSRYLGALSQGESGDYPDDGGGDPLRARTETVGEALGRHRLIVANHALLLANLEGFDTPDTLLIVDEAHAFEGAATEALSDEVAYQGFETLAADGARFAADVASGTAAGAAVASSAGSVERILDSGRLPNAAMRAFDRLAGPPDRNRSPRAAVLVSDYAGGGGRSHTFQVVGELRRLARSVGGLRRALGAFAAEVDLTTLDRFDADRYFALAARAKALGEASAAIVADVDAMWGPPPAASSGGGGNGPGGTGGTGGNNGEGAASSEDRVAVAADEGAGEQGDGSALGDEELADADDVAALPELVAAEEAAADDDASPPLDSGSGPGQVRPPHNRLVWAAELPGGRLAEGERHYRFRVVASPIDMPREPAWNGLRARFARSMWVSATLTVAGSWDYIRARWGFGPEVAAARLGSPFDYRSQARLVCLADFPSWAEHGDQALRSVAWQTAGFLTEAVRADPAGPGSDGVAPLAGGTMILTTSTAAAAGIAEHLAAELSGRWPERRPGEPAPVVHAAPLMGNARAMTAYRAGGGALVGTKGLWAGVDVAEPARTRLLWVNKLPFAPFADPLVATRRAAVLSRAEAAAAEDPEAVATETYYLPLAALELRQGIGRLIRSQAHRGVIVISDRKLAGDDRLRRLYRRVFLASLDEGLCAGDVGGDDPWATNVVPMTEAWARIWSFMADGGDIEAGRAGVLCAPGALEAQALLPETRAIRALALDTAEVAALAAAGRLADEVLKRSEVVAGHLRFAGGPVLLKGHQREVIARVAAGEDTLALLPTGYGKSFCYQLPALVLPGVTVVISPLVALMTDQALALNRSIGGAVRALVGPMRESVSRAGKAEVAAQLAGTADHGIRLVYVSPERAAQRAFADALRAGARSGALARLAVDEAHTLIAWGDDFRPAFRRLEGLVDELRTIAAAEGRTLPVTALTATANRTVREGLRSQLFGCPPGGGDRTGFATVAANPIRSEIAVWRRQLSRTRGGPVHMAGLVEAVADATPGHLIVYCTTVRETDTTWAQLRDWAGPEGAWRVRRFHGRLAEAEKTDVLNAFRDAPRAGEEGYVPMIVVATSAFGLGVDREDIAAVLVASPPTDLAALHQALGRAGRAQAGLPAGHPGRSGAIGMALATARGWRTVEFLTTRDLPGAVLEGAARAVLASGGLVDASEIGDRLLTREVAAGRVSPQRAVLWRTRDAYRLAVLRAVAALSSLGAVEDRGDLPEVVRIVAGDHHPEGPADAAFVAGVLAWPAEDRRALALERLTRRLVADGVVDRVEGPPEVWSRLLEAHALGWLDVSQAPTRRWLTAVAVGSPTVPAAYGPLIARRALRAAAELAELRAWWDDRSCAQEGLARYFDVAVPADACADAGCRCSTCWFDDAVVAADPTPQPELFAAFFAGRPRPVSAATETRQAAEVDRLVTRLLWDTYAGLGPTLLHSVLVGRDTIFNARTGERRPLRRRLLYHSAFGRKPGLRPQAVVDSLARLADADVAVAVDGGLWRWAGHVEADRRRAARAAAP